MVTRAQASSTSISCFTPKPPPMRGLTTRMRRMGRSRMRAMMRRTWKGTWVLVWITRRPLSSRYVWQTWVSIGACWAYCVSQVVSTTWAQAAKAAGASPTAMSTAAARLWAASQMPSASGSSWMTGAPGARRGVQGEHRGQHLVVHRDQAQGLHREARRLGGHDGHPVAHEADLGVEHAGVVGARLGVPLAGGGEADRGSVLVGEHQGHPGHGGRRRRRRCGGCGRGRGGWPGAPGAGCPASRGRRRTPGGR